MIKEKKRKQSSTQREQMLQISFISIPAFCRMMDELFNISWIRIRFVLFLCSIKQCQYISQKVVMTYL